MVVYLSSIVPHSLFCRCALSLSIGAGAQIIIVVRNILQWESDITQTTTVCCTCVLVSLSSTIQVFIATFHVPCRSKPVGILAKFFGESGKKNLPLQEFKSFLKDIHRGFAVLEFNHYDFNHTGYIQGWDFARSMCCGTDVRHVDAYLDKVSQISLDYHCFFLSVSSVESLLIVCTYL